jgi:hypothetical protein
MTKLQEQVKAAFGERMIELKVYFWTNDIAEGRGFIVPKHAWASGWVVMESNKAHGIQPGKNEVFHSLMELPAAIERVLIKHEIKLHHSSKMHKYFETSKHQKDKS